MAAKTFESYLKHIYGPWITPIIKSNLERCWNAATETAEEKFTSTNKQSKTVTINCTCGKRAATVHLCDECFRDAVTA